jgi:hypothetical protein
VRLRELRTAEAGDPRDERMFRAIMRDVGCNPFREEHIQILIQMDGAGSVRETEVKVWSLGF